MKCSLCKNKNYVQIQEKTTFSVENFQFRFTYIFTYIKKESRAADEMKDELKMVIKIAEIISSFILIHNVLEAIKLPLDTFTLHLFSRY